MGEPSKNKQPGRDVRKNIHIRISLKFKMYKPIHSVHCREGGGEGGYLFTGDLCTCRIRNGGSRRMPTQGSRPRDPVRSWATVR